MQRGRSCPGPAAGVGFLAWPFEGVNVFLGVPAGPPAPQGALRRRHLWIREAGGTWRAGAQGGERRPRSAEGGPRLRGAGPVPRALHTPSQRELRVSPWGPRLSPGVLTSPPEAHGVPVALQLGLPPPSASRHLPVSLHFGGCSAARPVAVSHGGAWRTRPSSCPSSETSEHLASGTVLSSGSRHKPALRGQEPQTLIPVTNGDGGRRARPVLRRARRTLLTDRDPEGSAVLVPALLLWG